MAVKGHGNVVVTRHTTGGENCKTCNLSLEHVEGGCRRSVVQGLCLHGLYGTYDIGNLLAGTVADDHGLFKDHLVFFHEDIYD